MSISRVIVGVVCLLFAGPVQATVFAFDCPTGCPVSDAAGKMVQSTFLYDDQSMDFAWNALFEPVMGNTPDGFWLVVNDGPEPQSTSDDLAILYGDGASGRVSAYVYDGANQQNSFEDPAIFIDSFENALAITIGSNGNATLALALDATSINEFRTDPAWMGLMFGETVGVWAHPVSGTQMDFDAMGRVLDFTFEQNTSYDRDDRFSRVVPEPGTAPLLALGLVALARRRYRRGRGG